MSRFQDRFDPLVWQVVRDIPPGRVMGYGEVARAAGFPRYSRLVTHAEIENYEGGQVRDTSAAHVVGRAEPLVEADSDDSLDRILWGPQE